MKGRSGTTGEKVTHRTLRVPVGTYTMLQKYASEMTKLHGFKISLPKALQILLHRHFTPDNHYDNPTKETNHEV